MSPRRDGSTRGCWGSARIRRRCADGAGGDRSSAGEGIQNASGSCAPIPANAGVRKRDGARRKFVRADCPPPLFSHEGVKTRAFEISFGFAKRSRIRERAHHHAKKRWVGTWRQIHRESLLL